MGHLVHDLAGRLLVLQRQVALEDGPAVHGAVSCCSIPGKQTLKRPDRLAKARLPHFPVPHPVVTPRDGNRGPRWRPGTPDSARGSFRAGSSTAPILRAVPPASRAGTCATGAISWSQIGQPNCLKRSRPRPSYPSLEEGASLEHSARRRTATWVLLTNCPASRSPGRWANRVRSPRASPRCTEAPISGSRVPGSRRQAR